jgi:dihydrolipoamide dehydrogenase
LEKIVLENFDIAIIGGGPGGYVAAIRAAQLGMKVALVEKEHLGGICLNWGCIPTKSLLRSAEIAHFIEQAESYGLAVEKFSFDLTKIVNRSRQVASKLSSGISLLLKKNKVTLFEGKAEFINSNQLKIAGSDKQIQAGHIIIATGARARELDNIPSDGKLIWTYKKALQPDALPKKLLVIGSGAIGIEFASFYNQLGSDVTVIEIADRILPAEDTEISNLAQKSFEKQGIKIHTNSSIVSYKKNKDDVSITLNISGKKQELNFDRVIVAAGIVGNVENMGLEKTKVKVEKSHIITNNYLQTDDASIFAIGDVAGAPWLAHKASHEAINCVEHIAGKKIHPIKKENIPGCTYCMPQIASVGLTEANALAAGYKIKVGRFNYLGNGKAIALGETEGLIKTIFDEKTGELLGAHMIGAEVTEMIGTFVLGKIMEATEEDFMHTVFPHPTLSEMIHESTLDAFSRAIHK